MKKGKFITFEGIDGSGKTSLVKEIACNLRELGFDVLTTQEPGGTQLGRRLREVFLSSSGSVNSGSEFLKLSDFVKTQSIIERNLCFIERENSPIKKIDFSDNKEPFSDNKEPFSDNKELFSDNKEPFSDNKEPFSVTKSISPVAEALLFAADRAQHVDLLLKPALKTGKIVISDRFADSSLAYQVAGRKLPLKMVKQLIKIASRDLTPDLTILLDLPVEKAILRKRNQKNEINRIDTEKVEFHERVRQTYLELASKEPKRFRIVSADKDYEEVKNATLGLILNFLKS